MPLRPRYLRALAGVQRATPRIGWLAAVTKVLVRFPVLSIQGVVTMDDETLEKHLALVEGEK